MTKLLIVDDSALMRKHLRLIFEESGFAEVRTARNGRDALEQVAAFNPDVVTLDVNMPEMDGLTCLAEIMAEAPRPVVMISSLTSESAGVTLEAMQLGAVDYVEKPGGTVSLNIGTIRDEMVEKVRIAAGARPRRARGLLDRVRRTREAKPPPAPRRRAGQSGRPDGCILIGVSTGGPRTLEDILPELPADLPWPVVVAQHMPGSFTGSFAQRLDRMCALTVREVTDPVPLAPGHVYIGRGDADVVVERRLGRLVITSVPSDPSLRWHPSVDRLVRSARAVLPPESLVAVELTGMGDDGAAAMAELREAGGRTIAESESSAVVFGMPAELIRRGGATLTLAARSIPAQLVRWVS
ncbi:two-component system, chemotaxis family, response regulator CheB [Methylobacterium sp. 174MFSha1.1]|uniref:chemotaxis-specific protein-glutamate methyltransferase CheB n=1 Tax=Methylobacterium sp. 174MFSha1.1 TaxID=1502749 RepID=UPI0008EDB22C|nr:chemotaxis-specific protein-glutamate methyltransferase CheB [Methylobacterium sp. 174MFSha1.1]SFU75412.1 two-component system, chemotaxis family, response regulator CheB [Methylobacterium sp. 174MFSha1.1]